MKQKKLEYKEEYHEKLVEHPEIDLATKEERALRLSMYKNFAQSFLKSVVVMIIAIIVIFGALYYLAKIKTGA